MSHATIDDVKKFGIMPPAEVDQIEAAWPGFVQGQCDFYSALADTALRKRHTLGLKAPSPVEVTGSVCQRVVLACYLRRGFDDSSKADRLALDQANEAKAWFDEIAEGTKELAATADATPLLDEHGVLSHTQPDPYAFLAEEDLQCR